MKIYFAGSIRGGRKDVLIYNNIINYLLTKGEVLTEHIGNIIKIYEIYIGNYRNICEHI